MRQEFPNTPEEAFVNSGNAVFKMEYCQNLRPDCRKPKLIGEVVGEEPASSGDHEKILSGLRFIPDMEATDAVLGDEDKRLLLRKISNKLQVWELPDTSIRMTNRYLVVFDPQRGLTDDADWGVISVFDRFWMTDGGKMELVAQFQGHLDKDVTIWIAAQIAKFYDNAMLVVECNTYTSEKKVDDSEFIFDTIKDYYDNLYSRTSAKDIREGKPHKYGFYTSHSSKVMIIDNYRFVLREHGYIERDEDAIEQAIYYEKTDDGGFEAKQGGHDDKLMTRMIACYVSKKMDLPREVEASDTAPIRTTVESYQRNNRE
jgi:hypothetical protein